MSQLIPVNMLVLCLRFCYCSHHCKVVHLLNIRQSTARRCDWLACQRIFWSRRCFARRLTCIIMYCIVWFSKNLFFIRIFNSNCVILYIFLHYLVTCTKQAHIIYINLSVHTTDKMQCIYALHININILKHLLMHIRYNNSAHIHYHLF